MSWQNCGYIKFRENLFRSSRYIYRQTDTYGDAKKRISETFHCHSANKRHLAHVPD